MEVKELAERLAKERAGGRRHVSRDLKRLLVAFAEQQRGSGASWKAIGEELGMSWQTLKFWHYRPRRPQQRRQLAPVKIVHEPVSAQLVVHAPSGLRIEHMTVPQLAELLRSLR